MKNSASTISRAKTLPYSVGLTDACTLLKRFATEQAASEFIATLEGYEDGRYYLDGPEG